MTLAAGGQAVGANHLDKPTAVRLGILFIVAAGLRLALLTTTQPTRLYTVWCPICDDVGAYNDLASNLVLTHEYQIKGQIMAERPPLYPAFLAGIYSVVGLQNYGAVRLIQVLLSTVTVLIFSQMAQRFFGSLAAWVTGGLMSIYPFFLIFSIELYSETLFTFLLACAMWFTLPFPDHAPLSIRRALLGGVVIGLSALTREVGLLVLPTFTIWHWFSQKRLWSRGLLILWLSALSVIGIWTVRNYLVWQRFIPLTTHTFANVIHGLVDDYGYYLDGASGVIPADVPPQTANPYAWLGEFNQVEQEEYSRQLVLSFCSHQPITCAVAWARNLAKLVNPVISNRAPWIIISTALLHGTVWVLGIAGLIKLLREHNYDFSLFLLTWFALCLGISAIAHVEIRYRVPIIDPFLMITGSYMVVALYQRFSPAASRK